MIGATTTFLTFKAKLALTGGFMAVLAAVDAQMPPASLEDYSLKALLLVAIIFVVRLLLKQQEEHKNEMRDLRDRHEKTLSTVVEKNTASNDRVCQLAEEQAAYFKTVTRDIVTEKLRTGKTGAAAQGGTDTVIP